MVHFYDGNLLFLVEVHLFCIEWALNLPSGSVDKYIRHPLLSYFSFVPVFVHIFLSLFTVEGATLSLHLQLVQISTIN